MYLYICGLCVFALDVKWNIVMRTRLHWTWLMSVTPAQMASWLLHCLDESVSVSSVCVHVCVCPKVDGRTKFVCMCTSRRTCTVLLCTWLLDGYFKQERCCINHIPPLTLNPKRVLIILCVCDIGTAVVYHNPGHWLDPPGQRGGARF